MMTKRIVIGISGASGVIYGIKMLSLLQKKDFETHLVISDSGRRNIEIETSLKADEVACMANYTYDNKDVGAALASGSYLTEGMVRDSQFLHEQSPCEGGRRDFEREAEIGSRGEGNTPPRGAS